MSGFNGHRDFTMMIRNRPMPLRKDYRGTSQTYRMNGNGNNGYEMKDGNGRNKSAYQK